ncbi:deoxyribodipyrimidine photo-lyase [Oceanicaulis sp. MMSF_3324]|uniref:cryptochrome/photolyase family protein n=1 Tax=Oceanicaulis sp. MMSF_3324 TaxID=3046702 RepID=UPI00273DB9B5|nr:deoxyribodipyrimidine photo-lyase [Oceanicaulis sp. MMSF_3324]
MSETNSPVIVWFRQDLRLADNPALQAAAASGAPIIPVYILDDDAPGGRKPGGASRWWLHHSLNSLSEDLQEINGHLIFMQGAAQAQLETLIQETGAQAVYWNRLYEPWARDRDERIKSALKDDGLKTRSFNGSLIVEPWDIATKTGNPYKVFTPFWKTLKADHAPAEPIGRPEAPVFSEYKGGLSLEAFELLPTQPDWSGGIKALWTPGETAAHGRLGQFLKQAVTDYPDRRNLPGENGTSRLSPHLHFGEISPRQVWHAVKQSNHARTDGADTYLSEIAWREFSYNLLYHFPDLPDANFQSKFDAFEWDDNAEALKAWQRGQTGYPIVDAGMRELWSTGWMHNRVRMIVASFLIKDLFIHWREGEAWFWDTLVDADLASNSASWQWTAGSGADAAPYFRVFNPVGQSEKFDPEGDYLRKWIPELADLPNKAIHAPWTADKAVLSRAGVTLGETYPKPIVDHGDARKRALAAFEKIKDSG